ncbi:hypothetical protein SPSYN_00513 [Sporotomaculum syntrophicum]|uniref:Uncharacterized protein n=1 Tax=Sporotomaculum syntrophicum TaxID=182264 RepID=A0A9D3AZD8_9FIRM|nr:hypothetical protein SPSYN_00513 [Sporotomaculum syntrophicum]
MSSFPREENCFLLSMTKFRAGNSTFFLRRAIPACPGLGIKDNFAFIIIMVNASGRYDIGSGGSVAKERKLSWRMLWRANHWYLLPTRGMKTTTSLTPSHYSE